MPEHLVLVSKKPQIGWLEHLSNKGEWSSSEERAFMFSQFYLRKLIALLFPDSFSQLSYIDGKHMVTKEIKGEAINWRELNSEEQRHFSKTLDILGIDFESIDLSGANFVREVNESGKTGRVFYTWMIFLIHFSSMSWPHKKQNLRTLTRALSLQALHAYNSIRRLLIQTR